MKRIKTIVYLGLVVIIASCGSSDSNNKLAKLQHQKDSLKTIYNDIAQQIAKLDEQIVSLDTAIQLPLVTVNRVEQRTFEHYVEIQGAVSVGGNALVYPEVPGKVTSIRYQEGDQVNRGDLVIQLDAGSLISTLKEVETNYQLAKDIYEKQSRLWNEKIGSEVQFLQAKNTKETLEQKIVTIKEQLDMYMIRAPFSGIIDEITPNVGESVNPAFPAFRVISYNNTELKADVSENYISTIKKDGKATIVFPSINKEFTTKITNTGNFINPNNRTFKITIDLSEFKENLNPNLLADIKIRDFKTDSAIVIPSNIIQQDRLSNEYIYVVEKQGNKSKAKKINITSGLSYQNYTLVVSGLKAGEMYIDKGARSIQDGELIEVVAE
ncbi:MAG: hypothetical protein CO118_06625 [Flavobacteriales bacterium CG_4_9_14_3_um_filter_32_8]|nr:MAG: hypothetical protein CO118_06625 [Flavobacteriales bacterium CG_4_9_14_3_um_filter_32_8]